MPFLTPLFQTPLLDHDQILSALLSEHITHVQPLLTTTTKIQNISITQKEISNGQQTWKSAQLHVSREMQIKATME